jgi:polar amino acid transport system substrate-binding protein
MNTFPPRARFTAAAFTAALALAALAGCAGTGAESSGGGSNSGGDSALPLMKEGKLTICANFGTPPNIFTEEDGTPVGAEVDIAKAMAEHLDLDTEFLEYQFAGLIPALQAKQCDTIMSSLYIKPEREEVADFVPYLLSASGVAVSADNPKGVTGYDDSLCGTRAIAITGATGADLLAEKSAECEADGKQPIEVTLTDRAADALQQTIADQVDAFMDTAELMGYYELQSDGRFMLVGEPVGAIRIGAATLKENAELHEALQSAFDSLIEDGTYADILEEWGMPGQDIADA